MFHHNAVLFSAINNSFPIFPQHDCTDGIRWIHEYFADCVDTEQKLYGFAVGIASLLFWFLPTIPQLVENYKLKQSEGLATGFLACWLIGDVCNLAGAVLTRQQAIQKCIGVYYIVQDLTLISQFVYYRRIYKQGTKVRIVALLVSVAVVLSLSAWTGFVVYSSRGGVDVDLKFGYALGIISAASYFGARSSQIYQNFRRKSCAGMSMCMFCVTIAGNVTYALAIVLECSDLAEMARHSPWLIGSCLCVVLDIALLAQFHRYRAAREGFQRFTEYV